MTDDVEAALRALQLEVPQPPDLTARVHAELSRPPKRHTVRNLIIAAITAFAVATAVSPAVRAGVVEILKFAGIEFRSQEPVNTQPPLDGQPVSLDEARKHVPFEIHVPAELGQPEHVTVHEGRFVTLHYKDKMLDQFDGTVETALAKIVGEEDVEQVDGAVWIPRPHHVFYIDRQGEWHREAARGTGKTLIWQRNAVTFRLQGEVTKEEALRIRSS